jgi:hypothetical protein
MIKVPSAAVSPRHTRGELSFDMLHKLFPRAPKNLLGLGKLFESSAPERRKDPAPTPMSEGEQRVSSPTIPNIRLSAGHLIWRSAGGGQTVSVLGSVLTEVSHPGISICLMILSVSESVSLAVVRPLPLQR